MSHTGSRRDAGCTRRSVLRTVIAAMALPFVRASAATSGGEMEIKRSGSQPSAKGPAEWFTGTVRIDPLLDAPSPARANGASVTFEPGARTAWHTHPLGQTLIVMSGVGRAQRWGGPIEEIRPGDVIWIPPGEKHWHGAAPTTAMTHIAHPGKARWQARGLAGTRDRRTVRRTSERGLIRRLVEVSDGAIRADRHALSAPTMRTRRE